MAEGKKILVVDDDTIFLELVKTWLQKEGYKTITASDGNQALNAVYKENLDMIIMDLILPEMNGLKLCETIKADDRYKNIPIILFSGFSRASEKDLPQKTGADYFLVKPFETDELLKKVSELLSR